VCFVTLLFRVFAGSMCLADGLGSALDSSAIAGPLFVVAADHSSSESGCVLGETAGCHCACAHSIPLPPNSSAATHVGIRRTPDWPAVLTNSIPTLVGSLLRPPIA